MNLFKHRSSKWMYPKKFFCCISLEVGGMIVGWLWTVKSILFLVIAAVYLFTGEPALPSKVNADSVLALVITSSTVNLIASIMLIVAITKQRPYLILPWTIVNMLTTTFFTFGYGTGDSTALFIALLAMALFFYVWFCMISLHHRLRYPHMFVEPSEPESEYSRTESNLPPYIIHKDEL